MRPIGAHVGKVRFFGSFCFRGELGFLNSDAICMCVVNKQFELLELVLDSIYADLQYDEIFLSLLLLGLCGVCSYVVVLGLSVRLSWYPVLWVRWLRCL